jgi:hypothetical protein
MLLHLLVISKSFAHSKGFKVYFWPNMCKDVECVVKSFDSCQKVKASKQKKVGPLQPLPNPGRRWESTSMDLTAD